jgi:O-antigen/teichoic acid export membrane protein
VSVRAQTLGNALGTAGSNLLAAGITVALSVVVARLVGPASKGSFDLIVATSAFAALGFGLGIPSGVTLLVAREPALARRIPYPAAAMSTVVGLFVALAATAYGIWAKSTGSGEPNDAFPEGIAVGLLTAATSYAAITKATLIGIGRIGVANMLDLSGRLLGLGLVLAIGFVATPGVLASAIAVGVILGGLFQSAALRPSNWVDRGSVVTMLRQGLPAYVSSGMQLINYRFDLFIVGFYWGPAQVGLYAVAGLLAQLVWVLARAAATALYPVFVQGDEESGIRRLGEASRIAALLGLAGAAFLAVATPFALPMVYGLPFAEAVPALWALLPGAAILSPAIMGAAYFLGRATPQKNAFPSAAGLIVTIGLGLLIVPRWGMFGAAVVSSLSYGMTSILTFALVRTATGLSVRDQLVPHSADIRRLWESSRALRRDLPNERSAS